MMHGPHWEWFRDQQSHGALSSMDGILSSAVDFFARHDPGVQLAVGTVASAA